MPSNKRARQRAAREARLAAEAARKRRKRTIRQFSIIGLIVVALFVVFVVVPDLRGTPAKPTANGSTPVKWTEACSAAELAAPAETHFGPTPPPMTIDPKRQYQAILQTDAGSITARLDPASPDGAPNAVNSFVSLACHKFFNGSIFDPVVTGAKDQVGAPPGAGAGATVPGYSLPDEYPTRSGKPAPYADGDLTLVPTVPGTSAAGQLVIVATGGARTFNTEFNHSGNTGGSILGHVTSGMDVVEHINADGSPSGVPKKPHHIVSVKVQVSVPVVTSPPKTTTTTTTLVAVAKWNAACSPAVLAEARQTHFTAMPSMSIDTHSQYQATLHTDAGDIVIRLDPVKAPQTVNSFVFLACHLYYDGTIFHRVIQSFMDQGGDANGNPPGTGGPGYTIPDEFPPKASNPKQQYPIGAFAMANTGAANSGGSQFFIVTGPEGESLANNYTLFGQVTSGMDVAQKINADGAPSSSQTGTPKVTHHLLSVTVQTSSSSFAVQ